MGMRCKASSQSIHRLFDYVIRDTGRDDGSDHILREPANPSVLVRKQKNLLPDVQAIGNDTKVHRNRRIEHAPQPCVSRM